MISRTPGLIAVLLTLLAAAPGAAELGAPAGWSQERATELAGQARQEIGAIQNAVATSPEQPTYAQQRDMDAAMAIVKHMESVAGDLLEALRGGEGYHQTLPIYEKLVRLRETAGFHGGELERYESWDEEVDRYLKLEAELGALYAESP